MEREVLSEIREMKEKLSIIEYLLRANLVPEDEPTPDEEKAIREFENSFQAGKEKLIPLGKVLAVAKRDKDVAVPRRAGKKSR